MTNRLDVALFGQVTSPESNRLPGKAGMNGWSAGTSVSGRQSKGGPGNADSNWVKQLKIPYFPGAAPSQQSLGGTHLVIGHSSVLKRLTRRRRVRTRPHSLQPSLQLSQVLQE